MNHLIIDVEGTNRKFVYDLGGVVIDNKGNVLDSFSFVIRDTFYHKTCEMNTCYYSDKLPQYVADIAAGTREVINMINAKIFVDAICERYGITKVWAFNAAYDSTALDKTISDATGGKVSRFLSKGIEWHCIMGAALSTMCKTRKYAAWAPRTNKGNARCNAETVYQYMTNNPDFVEDHTGLKDAEIEAEILTRCLSYHKHLDTKPGRCQSFPGYAILQAYKI